MMGDPVPSAPIDVASLVAGRCEAWRVAADGVNVRLVADVDAPPVRSVPGRLEQVLDNLISNALDVAPPGSEIVVAAHRQDDEVRLEVRDAGPGMTAEQRARAFDRFWRAAAPSSSGGFGLGLAIVGRLVTADGGSVELAEAPEGGLAVVLRLPAADTSVPARSEAPV